MSILKRIRLQNVVMAMTVAAALGCGSATNNDQGTSFLALGFFETGDGDAGDAGTVVYLNNDVEGLQGVIPLFVPIDKDPEEEGLQGGYIGLQNNLSAQFIRSERIDCCYTVPGADSSLNIPCDSWHFTTVLPASEGEEPATSYSQVEIVSPDIIAYLNVNTNSLPELPYRMVAECTVVGVSQAGDVFETNPVFYQIQFAELPECCEGVGEGFGGGFQEGAGVGGDINSFGDPEEEAVVEEVLTEDEES
ncbi:MAG: hypothetical protein IT291_03250 [Deltaproteobacteria bacterium]|nr:hypothetical protein [Deltaproteobacteria bacterium]